MSLELTTLRLLRSRQEYERLKSAVPKGVLEPKAETILNDYGRFFREYPDATEITPDEFLFVFKAAHPTISADVMPFYENIIRNEITQPVPQHLRDGLMNRLVAGDAANKVLRLLESFNAGDEIDLNVELNSLIETFNTEINKKVKVPWVNDHIEDLLKDDEHDVGFHWRIPELNDSLRPLRGGDAILVAGRPDTGKTTFLTDQLTYMAPQVDKIYPGEMRHILWLNNEGPGKRIKLRLYQSALNASSNDLVERNKAGTIGSDYLAATGRPDIIRVFDVHDFWNHELEEIIRKFPPAIVVFDMVDNVKFGGSVNNNGQRTDQLLEAMYQWARIIAVKHDCVSIMTSQISSDGENIPYPHLSMLKDSKTGKQGAADAILTLGYVADYPDIRYIGTTKNKLAREAGPKNPRCETRFDGLRGRYLSPLMIRS